MSAFRKNFSRFLSAEDGAITVDYVVLTAAATGLAIAAASELSAGLSLVTSVVSAELAAQGDPVDGRQVLIYNDGFLNDTGDWNGATVSEVFGIGSVLGPIEGANGGAEQVTRQFALEENLESVSLDFDLYAMDDFEDNDEGFIYIDGRKVGTVTKDQEGNAVFNSHDTSGDFEVEVSALILEDNVQLGGAMVVGASSLDSRIAVSIKVKNPTTNVDFGFGSNATGNALNESFAIDNFKVTGVKANEEEPNDDP
ncbi:MAG: hypothetical protein AAF366_20145 [Pseudomonadota bacterium]